MTITTEEEKAGKRGQEGVQSISQGGQGCSLGAAGLSGHLKSNEHKTQSASNTESPPLSPKAETKMPKARPQATCLMASCSSFIPTLKDIDTTHFFHQLPSDSPLPPQ